MSDDGWRTSIRWVVAHPTEPKVLLGRRDGALCLPGTERPGRAWTAEPGQILPGLRDLLGVDALLLRCLDEHEEPSAQVQRATLLAVPRALPALPDGLAWAGRAELAGPAGDDAALAARVVEELAGSGTGQRGQPWAARGWFAGAERWLHEALAAIGRPLTGPVEQMQVWDLSCVLRAPTAAGHVWFKATAASPLFVNEGLVMGALAGLFGDRVPAPVAVDPERGWMVLDDLGQEVGWEAPLEVVEEVVRAFARLQVEAAGQVDRLLAAGCHDRRLDRLAAQARDWLPAIEATGELAGIDDATWLSQDELAAVRAALPEVLARCEELAGHAVPPSIVHGDLHLGNVAKGPAGYRFFDWSDACVAHPFFDLLTMRRGTGFAEEEGDGELPDRLRAAYLPAWAPFEPPGRLARAFQLAVPLGALHHAVSYRSLVAGMTPPVESHMAGSTAWWLRQMLAGLRDLS
ncbi:MAG TPA: aminoglycoside phosphotransferase family protein [Actinomycetota bacterium]